MVVVLIGSACAQESLAWIGENHIAIHGVRTDRFNRWATGTTGTAGADARVATVIPAFARSHRFERGKLGPGICRDDVPTLCRAEVRCVRGERTLLDRPIPQPRPVSLPRGHTCPLPSPRAYVQPDFRLPFRDPSRCITDGYLVRDEIPGIERIAAHSFCEHHR